MLAAAMKGHSSCCSTFALKTLNALKQKSKYKKPKRSMSRKRKKYNNLRNKYKRQAIIIFSSRCCCCCYFCCCYCCCCCRVAFGKWQQHFILLLLLLPEPVAAHGCKFQLENALLWKHPTYIYTYIRTYAKLYAHSYWKVLVCGMHIKEWEFRTGTFVFIRL